MTTLPLPPRNPRSHTPEFLHIVDDIDESVGPATDGPTPCRTGPETAAPVPAGLRLAPDGPADSPMASTNPAKDGSRDHGFQERGRVGSKVDPTPPPPWDQDRPVPSFFHGHHDYRRIIDRWYGRLERHRAEGKISQQVAEWHTEWELRLIYGTNPLTATAKKKTKTKPADGQLHFGDGASTHTPLT